MFSFSGDARTRTLRATFYAISSTHIELYKQLVICNCLKLVSVYRLIFTYIWQLVIYSLLQSYLLIFIPLYGRLKDLLEYNYRSESETTFRKLIVRVTPLYLEVNMKMSVTSCEPVARNSPDPRPVVAPHDAYGKKGN